MEDRETPRMHKYGERKTTQIVMATVPHVPDWVGRTKYHGDGFLLDCEYMSRSGKPNYFLNVQNQ